MRFTPVGGRRTAPSEVVRRSWWSSGRLARFVLPLLAVLSASPLAAQNAEALTAHEAERTERFLETRVACRGCHIIAGEGGVIGPPLDGIRERAEYDYVFAMIQSPGSTVPGTLMPHQIMPRREVDRLARYLMATPALDASTEVPPAQAPVAIGPGDEDAGAALYARHCVACHGPTGQGDGWNAPNLPVTPTAHGDDELMALRADDTLYDAISGGGYVLDRSPLMPAFGQMLTPAQIRALVAHIRTLCACEEPAWARGGRL